MRPFLSAGILLAATLSLAQPVSAPVESLAELGMRYYDQGRYSDARDVFQRAARATERRAGGKSPEYALSLTNLAAAHDACGDRRRSESLLRAAIDIYLASGPPDDPGLAIARNELAEHSIRKRRWAEAELLLAAARVSLERNFGPSHERVAVAVNNLAALRRGEGRLAEAATLFAESVAIMERAKGPDHPYLLRALNNLAVARQEAGRYADAEAIFRRALAIADRHLPAGHPQATSLLTNYAAMLKRIGRKDEAKPLLDRAAAARADYAGGQ